MTDAICYRCGEPWDVTGGLGHTHTDMTFWQFENFIHGAGCPCCRGEINERIPEPERRERWTHSLMGATDEIMIEPPPLWSTERAWDWNGPTALEMLHEYAEHRKNETALLLLQLKAAKFMFNEFQDGDLKANALYAVFESRGVFEPSIRGDTNRDVIYNDWTVLDDDSVTYRIGEVCTNGAIQFYPGKVRHLYELGENWKEMEDAGNGVLDEDAYLNALEERENEEREKQTDDLKVDVADFIGLARPGMLDIDDLVGNESSDPEHPSFELSPTWKKSVAGWCRPLGWQFFRCTIPGTRVYAALPAGQELKMGVDVHVLAYTHDDVAWDTFPAHEFMVGRAGPDWLNWSALPEDVCVAYLNYFAEEG